MPSMTPEDINMITGGRTTSPPPTNPPSPPPITVTGVPPTFPPSPPPFSPPPTGGGGGQSPTPPPPPPPPPPRKIKDYTKRCSSAAGSAADISKMVRGPAVSGPPNPITDPEGHDWTEVEFEAVIGGTGSSYGSIGDGIYSNDEAMFAVAPSNTTATGIWHNHPSSGRSASQILDDRYPSTNTEGNDDWQTLQTLATNVAPNDPSFNPSLFITDSQGVTREFKLSDRSSIEGLSDTQRQQGMDLDGRDRSNQSCS